MWTYRALYIFIAIIFTGLVLWSLFISNDVLEDRLFRGFIAFFVLSIFGYIFFEREIFRQRENDELADKIINSIALNKTTVFESEADLYHSLSKDVVRHTSTPKDNVIYSTSLFFIEETSAHSEGKSTFFETLARNLANSGTKYNLIATAEKVEIFWDEIYRRSQIFQAQGMRYGSDYEYKAIEQSFPIDFTIFDDCIYIYIRNLDLSSAKINGMKISGSAVSGLFRDWYMRTMWGQKSAPINVEHLQGMLLSES